jgi:hypothetical protein
MSKCREACMQSTHYYRSTRASCRSVIRWVRWLQPGLSCMLALTLNCSIGSHHSVTNVLYSISTVDYVICHVFEYVLCATDCSQVYNMEFTGKWCAQHWLFIHVCYWTDILQWQSFESGRSVTSWNGDKSLDDVASSSTSKWTYYLCINTCFENKSRAWCSKRSNYS